jgi:outer membrane protein OmpA-like peptidoglycan-associated protein
MKKIVILLSVPVLLASCIGNKKITAAKNKLNGIEEQMKKENAEIGEINSQAEVKLQSNKIDNNILKRIDSRLAKSSAQLAAAQTKVDQLNEILKDKKSTRKNYKTIIVPVLDSLQQQSDQYAQRLALYLMIKDGLSVADFKLFDLAAFFGPGKYIIPEDKVDLAALSFSPVMDSLMQFSNKYNQFPRTATLIILGFADGTGINTGGELYYTLLDELRKPQAEKEELNQKLSELRAKELIKQLTNLYLKKATGFKDADKLIIEYLGQGKGEALPISSIKDYAVDDERRRVVLCYWAVLPD